ncbi:PEP-CTERM sorting domain-containing protein [Coraliomargarita algicola]|uniref:PEP-CTERM sorting domain-containing protein n=1 Tax=Coraliomargarita algicola TaxID=3092156 RepID=A0ABZ0RMU4_9BACT|nr:PEP-CTERM sorting domain-containing protein [Coraliomargarita sp. J2-16]WPJ94264.1 PEP-CTERM sorting domain-containing protein [Coraliomargarita sp. J2-16]
MKRLLIVAALTTACISLQATVTININSTGWGDASSTGVNDLAWGIIVDSDGNSVGGDFGGTFISDLSAALVGFSLPGTGTFNSGVNIFDEYYFVQGQDLTTNSGPPAFSDGYMSIVGVNLDGNVSAGDDYGLLWFSVANGTLTNSDFFGFQDIGLLPADSSVISPSTTPGQTSNAIGVPEPSAFAAMAGLMALGFVMVRRRG